MKKTKRRGRIQNRSILLLILLGLVIFIGNGLLGYYEVSNSLLKVYYQEAYKIAHTLEDNINAAELETAFNQLEASIENGTLEETRAQIENSETYKTIDNNLKILKRDFDCNRIFIVKTYGDDVELLRKYREITNRALTSEELESYKGSDTLIFMIYACYFNEGTYPDTGDTLAPGTLAGTNKNGVKKL